MFLTLEGFINYARILLIDYTSLLSLSLVGFLVAFIWSFSDVFRFRISLYINYELAMILVEVPEHFIELGLLIWKLDSQLMIFYLPLNYYNNIILNIKFS